MSPKLSFEHQPNTTMTADEQRVAIAKACGWNPDPSDRRPDESWGFSTRFPEWVHLHHLPDYLSDLNACAEMEKTLSYEELYDYWSHLEDIVEELPKDETSPNEVEWWQFHASAPQRCKAFLLTKGEWKP